MSRGLWQVTGAVWLVAAGAAFAAPRDSEDLAPWHLQSAARLDHAHPAMESAEPAAGDRPTYLHLRLKFRPDATDRKLHQFRITDTKGRTVADITGFHRDRSLLIFEGEWKSLAGLYLEGMGHREPLFSTAALPTESLQQPTAGPRPSRTEPPRSTVPTAASGRDPIVDRTPERAAGEPSGRQRVVVDGNAPQRVGEGVSRTRVVRERPGGADPTPRAGAVRDVAAGSRGEAQNPWDIDPPLEDLSRTNPTAANSQRASAPNAEDRNPAARPAPNNSDADGRNADANPGTGREAAKGAEGGSGQESGSTAGRAAARNASAGSNAGMDSASASGGGGAGGGSGTGRGLHGRRDGRPGTRVDSDSDGDEASGEVGPGRIVGTGLPGAVGAGSGSGMGAGSGNIHLRERRSDAEFKSPPPRILYLSCVDEFGRGRIYQVDEHGIILGLVTLPYAATGLALHRQPLLAAAVPRDRGKIFGIDAAGKVSVILEDDPLLPQPVDVGIAGTSDALVAADNLAHVLAGTSIAGEKAREFRRFELQTWDRPAMSVAVTPDKHVLLANEMEPGVYRFPAGDFSPRTPVLPRFGGVAADAGSLCWGAVQPPNQVVLFDGDAVAKTLRLPAGKTAYRQGLLSFAPAARLVVAAQSTDEARGGVWFIELATREESARNLFVWNKEPVLDFVVGPRMPWEPYASDKLRSLR